MNTPSRVSTPTGPPSGTGLKDQLYIGEADDVRDRVDQHLRARTSGRRSSHSPARTKTLNKAHVRYLEARLVQLAVKAGRINLLNGTVPAVPKLSEPDRAAWRPTYARCFVIPPLLA